MRSVRSVPSFLDRVPVALVVLPQLCMATFTCSIFSPPETTPKWCNFLKHIWINFKYNDVKNKVVLWSTLELRMVQCQWHWTIHSCSVDLLFIYNPLTHKQLTVMWISCQKTDPYIFKTRSIISKINLQIKHKGHYGSHLIIADLKLHYSHTYIIHYQSTKIISLQLWFQLTSRFHDIVSKATTINTSNVLIIHN